MANLGAVQLSGDSAGTARATRDGFDAWYRAEHPRLLAIVTVAAGDADVAQEIVAEAFARALAAWGRVADMDAPAAWTYRVAVNLLARRGRRAAIERRLLRRAARTDAVFDDHGIEVWELVRSLPPRERLAVALRYAGGCTESEVAQAMGVAVGTASATLASARRRLASMLAEEDDHA